MATSLQLVDGQRLLDSLPEPVLQKMQISLKTNVRNTFWHTHITIKWPESRNFSVRGTSREEVEKRIYEMIHTYLERKSVIVATNHSSMLEVESKSIDSQAQENKVISGSESSLLFGMQKIRAPSVVGVPSLFNKSASSILSQECDSVLSRMMHDLVITTNSGDEKAERKVSLKQTSSCKSDATARDNSDNSSSRKRKLEFTEVLSCPSLTITFQNELASQNTSLSSKRQRKKTRTRKERKVVKKTAIKSSEEKLNPVLLQLEPRFRVPRSVVHNYYQILTQQLCSENGCFKIRYEQKSERPPKWECIIQVKWPEPRSFSAVKQSKTLAAEEASLHIIEWLQSLGRITRKGAPVFCKPEEVKELELAPTTRCLDPNAIQKLKELLDVNTKSSCKPKEEKEVEIAPAKTSLDPNAVQELEELLDVNTKIPCKPKEEKEVEIAPAETSLDANAVQELNELLDANMKGATSQFNSNSRNSASDNSVEIEKQPSSETQGSNKGLQKVELRFPAPKSVIQQFCQAVANLLDSDDYKVKIKHTMRCKSPIKWECSLEIKWPEPRTFVVVKPSKSLATKEAALLALQWLQSLGKITKRGFPVMCDTKEVEISPPVEVSVDSTSVKEAQQLVDKYMQTIKPQLEDCDLSSSLKELEDEINDIKAKMEPGTDAGTRQLENALFTSGKKRNPATGRIVHEVGQEVLKQRNKELYRRSQMRTDSQMWGKLPIMAFRDSILEMLEKNRVLVIKGQPGCGKSTLVPHFIMENFASRKQGAHCNIVITQPRRISAISLSEWVAREREEELGDVVGYEVRFRSLLPKSVGGAILFCTSGILLRRLIDNPGLFGASHIIVDEAHERDINTDVLLILLRRALKLNPDLKVVVMSATVNAELFQNYFNEAATISIPGFTHPVKSIFMDDFAAHNIPVKLNIDPECPSVNTKAVANLVQWIHRNRQTEGAILCFLPGWAEIKSIQDSLNKDKELMVLPSHSKLGFSEQKKIFQSPPPGMRKVILSTNITETSITIDDVEYVIDTGMHREHRLDIDTGLLTFSNHWISKASVNQRRGRAGRVKPGESFHLYSTRQFENMEPFPIAEILRIPLEKTVLDCKAYSREEKAAEFLSQMPEVPALQAVENAVQELKRLGTLDVEENLTPLGKRIALFTVHPKLSIALIFAVIFRCVSPIVTIASIFGNDVELFCGSLVDKERIKEVKKIYHPSSDHLAIAWLYQQWEKLNNESPVKASSFCYSRKLLSDQMELVGKLRHLISKYLKDCVMLKEENNFADLEARCNMYVGNDELVKGVLLSAFGTLILVQDYDWHNGRLVRQKVLVSDTGNRVLLRSESVNHGRTKFMSKFLTHFQQTGLTERKRIMVRETTMVSPLTLLLFLPGSFEVIEIHSKNKKWEGCVLLQHRNQKVELMMKKEEAAVFMELRIIIWNIVHYFIIKEGVEEDLNRYRTISDFYEKLLRTVSNIMEKAGASIEYKNGILVT